MAIMHAEELDERYTIQSTSYGAQAIRDVMVYEEEDRVLVQLRNGMDLTYAIGEPVLVLD